MFFASCDCIASTNACWRRTVIESLYKFIIWTLFVALASSSSAPLARLCKFFFEQPPSGIFIQASVRFLSSNPALLYPLSAISCKLDNFWLYLALSSTSCHSFTPCSVPDILFALTFCWARWIHPSTAPADPNLLHTAN